ncbi:hypothetical protein HX744_14920 [Pseudonocardia sp. ICBG1122]|nr:hypothetical protein [Pseudonocardia pini]
MATLLAEAAPTAHRAADQLGHATISMTPAYHPGRKVAQTGAARGRFSPHARPAGDLLVARPRRCQAGE